MTETNLPNSPDIQTRIDALYAEGEALSAESRRQIVALGSAATTKLLEILEDQRLWDDQAQGEGFAPIYAAEILGQVADPDALGRLYAVFRRVDPDAILDDALTGAIRAYKKAAIPAGLRELKDWDDPFLAQLAYLFSGLNFSPDLTSHPDTQADQSSKRDADENKRSPDDQFDEKLHRKTLQVLLKYFLQDPIAGSDYLADFGDPVALDAMTVALDRYIAAAGGEPKFRRPIFALTEAIGRLGGDLSAAQRSEINRLKHRRKRSEEVLDAIDAKPPADDSRTVVNDHSLGRNDPCWCGSGRKYKRCHLSEDTRLENKPEP